MGMANGATVIKGRITILNGQTNAISFGRTFSKYFCLTEMTDESKAMLMASGMAGSKSYAHLVTYPIPEINDDAPTNIALTYRINPTTQETTTSSGIPANYFGDSIVLVHGAGASVYYVGYTYDYIIVGYE